jgi:hypothetical protein
MIRKILLAAGATFLFASPTFAAPACKDAHGKFVKCPPPAPAKPVAVKPAQCRDTHGKFIKCPVAAPAKPAPAARCRDAHGKFAKCGTPGAKRA